METTFRKIIKYILLLLFMGIATYNQLNNRFGLVNIIFSILFLVTYKTLVKKRINYFVSVLFLFPVFAYLAILILEIINDTTNIEADEIELSDFESDIFYNYKVYKPKVEDSLSKIPWNNIFFKDDSQLKKDFIINSVDLSPEYRVKILKVALKDKDPEVVHYSAVALNSINNFYRDKIKNSKDNMTLIKNYIEYCNSGLLHSTIVNKFVNKIEILLFGENTEIEEIETIVLLKFYKLKGMYLEVERILDDLILKNKLNIEISKFANKFYHERNLGEKFKNLEKIYPYKR